ncbi:MAG: DUF3794 domain-containing protein [Firmicutes bacterium]|nr:DUF3794 domain-containing protein [Bacillota bacterium]
MSQIRQQLIVTREPLRLEEVIAEGTTQQNVIGIITVPPQKPNVTQVIDSIGQVTITKVTVVPNKVLVEGILSVKAIYEAAVPAQTVHVVHGDIAFAGFVELPGVEPDMTAQVTAEIEHLAVDVGAQTGGGEGSCPGGRTLEVVAILRLTARVVRTVELEVVTEVTGVEGLVVQREAIRTEVTVGEGERQAVVQSTVPVPPQKPSVAQVIDFLATARVTEVRPLPNKVIIEGEIDIKIIYEAAVPTQTVHVMHATIPFHQFVDVPGVQPGMMVVADVSIEHATFDVGSEGRTVVARIILMLRARVTRTQTINVVVNVTGVPGLQVEFATVRVVEARGQGTTQSIVREVVDIPETKPDAVQILDIRTQARTRRIIVVPRKVIIEGTLQQKIMYEGRTFDQAVHVVEHTTDFSDFVVIPEAAPGMRAQASFRVEFATGDVGTGDPISVQDGIGHTSGAEKP